MRNVCTIAECEALVHGHGLCSSHWNRLRRYGDPRATKPRAPGRRATVTVDAQHPLAWACLKVRRARVVLWEKLGGQDAPCHWCGLPLRWVVALITESPPDSLYADHLNSDTQDDRPENLVPACHN